MTQPSALMREVVTAYKTGELVKDIAARFKIANSTVTRYARKAGVPIRPAHRSRSACWRAAWFWTEARLFWPDDARILEANHYREIYGSAAEKAGARMHARYHTALWLTSPGSPVAAMALARAATKKAEDKP